MKTAQILVGQPSDAFLFTSGRPVAVLPAVKGREFSSILFESGKMSDIEGMRLNGKGVANAFKDAGFTLAKAGDSYAEKLAHFADKREGLKLVQTGSQDQAFELNVRWAGQSMFFVPFDRAAEVVEAKMTGSTGYCVTAVDRILGFSSGLVNVEPLRNHGFGLALSKGWIVATQAEVDAAPRFDIGDELIEHAVYTICNSGFGRLKGDSRFHENASDVDADTARGKLVISLNNGDELQVGGTGCDEVGIKYLRNGQVVHSESDTVDSPVMGSYVALIMSVYVRVKEMDAALAAKTAKKTKKAA